MDAATNTKVETVAWSKEISQSHWDSIFSAKEVKEETKEVDGV